MQSHKENIFAVLCGLFVKSIIVSSYEIANRRSIFFALVGTHGLHITAGLLWVTVIIAQLQFQGLTTDTFRRLVIFSLFWHFLDLIWIFIFTLVYLMGVI